MDRPLTPLHAQVGVELPAGEAVEGPRILHLLARHACVLMRGLSLDAEQLMVLARELGEPLPPYRPQYSVPGFPELVQIGNVRQGGEVTTYLNRGGIEWHSDSPGSSHPPGCSLLYCLESTLPDGGGETGFASTVAGYRNLPDALRRQISDLKIVHSFNTFNDQVANYDRSAVPAQDGRLRERNRDTVDPIVQRHPETGEPHLYVSHAMIKRFEGLGMDEGRKLVMQVVDHVTAPEHIYKHKWRPGDLMVFDNRTCLHTPFPYDFDDFPRTRRLLHQVIIGGRS